MTRRLLPITAALLLGAACTTPPEDEENPPIPEACSPGPTDEFTLGVVIFDNPRWFRAFDEGCETIEMETGLQGGWHIEPALQAPRTAASADLGGRIYWTVRNEAGDVVADAEFELFRNFWQALEGGDAYWGDFVIFDRNPGGLIGTELTIECRLEFDERSSQDDVTVERTVTFVDEEEATEFF